VLFLKQINTSYSLLSGILFSDSTTLQLCDLESFLDFSVSHRVFQMVKGVTAYTALDECPADHKYSMKTASFTY
jgi:hypothetical protein